MAERLHFLPRIIAAILAVAIGVAGLYAATALSEDVSATSEDVTPGSGAGQHRGGAHSWYIWAGDEVGEP